MRILTPQSKIDYTNYYRNALLFLACLPEPSPLSQEESQTRAYNLSIAALLAEKIYNFGELLQHPILNELQNTNSAWVGELLFAMNAGDLDKFAKLSSQFPSIVILVSIIANCSRFSRVIRPCCKRKFICLLYFLLYSPDHRIVEHYHFNSSRRKLNSRSMKSNISS